MTSYGSGALSPPVAAAARAEPTARRFVQAVARRGPSRDRPPKHFSRTRPAALELRPPPQSPLHETRPPGGAAQGTRGNRATNPQHLPMHWSRLRDRAEAENTTKPGTDGARTPDFRGVLSASSGLESSASRTGRCRGGHPGAAVCLTAPFHRTSLDPPLADLHRPCRWEVPA